MTRRLTLAATAALIATTTLTGCADKTPEPPARSSSKAPITAPASTGAVARDACLTLMQKRAQNLKFRIESIELGEFHKVDLFHDRSRWTAPMTYRSTDLGTNTTTTVHGICSTYPDGTHPEWKKNVGG